MKKLIATVIGLAFAGISFSALALPTVLTTTAGFNVMCGWDVNRDGKVDFSIAAKLPAQRSTYINWTSRCHKARLVADDTYTNSDLYNPDPTNTTVFHNAGHAFYDDLDSLPDASIDVKLPKQFDPDKSFTPRNFWKVRQQLDDTFTKPYPIP